MIQSSLIFIKSNILLLSFIPYIAFILKKICSHAKIIQVYLYFHPALIQFGFLSESLPYEPSGNLKLAYEHDVKCRLLFQIIKKTPWQNFFE